MTKTVKLPSLGESVESGRVLSILVSPGDRVGVEDPILEIETDKATVEVPAQDEGTVEEILVAEGDEVEAGQELLVLGTGDSAESGGEPDDTGEESDAEERAAAKPDAKEAERKRGEDQDERDEDAAADAGSAEREKERTEPPKKKKRKQKQDAEPKPKQEARRKEKDEEPEPEEREERPEERSRAAADDGDSAAGVAAEPASPAPGRPSAPPRVRRLARQLGVDLARVAAADAEHITEEDLHSHVRDALVRSRTDGADDEPELPDFSTWGEVEREPVDGIRRSTAQTVRDSWRRIPQVTHFDSARIDDLEEFRARHGDDGGRISLTAVLVKVVGEALSRFPRFNASYDARAGEVVLKRYVHVGVAIDTERGLLVPVLRDVHEKGVRDIAEELPDVLESARGGDLAPDDLAGATFTISNVGSIGGSHFTPLVVWPQVAILGIGRAAVQLARDGERTVEVQTLPLSLSYDHRVIDGADAARFTRWIADSIEDPMTMLLEG